MAQNDTHVALIILTTQMLGGGGIIGGKNFFGPNFVFLRLWRQHPFLHKTKGPTRNPISPPPPPPSAGVHVTPPPPPPPPQSNFQVALTCNTRAPVPPRRRTMSAADPGGKKRPGLREKMPGGGGGLWHQSEKRKLSPAILFPCPNTPAPPPPCGGARGISQPQRTLYPPCAVGDQRSVVECIWSGDSAEVCRAFGVCVCVCVRARARAGRRGGCRTRSPCGP